MKSRTSVAFTQRPGLKPSHAGFSCTAAPWLETPGETEMLGDIAVLLPVRLVRKFLSQPEQRPRVPGYHHLLVGRDDPRRDLALLPGDSRAVGLVRALVEFDAQPARRLADAPANLGRVLADARREDQAVQAAQHGGQRADLPGDAVDEVVHRQARVGFAPAQQVAHVVADAGDAEQ